MHTSSSYCQPTYITRSQQELARSTVWWCICTPVNVSLMDDMSTTKCRLLCFRLTYFPLIPHNTVDFTSIYSEFSWFLSLPCHCCACVYYCLLISAPSLRVYYCQQLTLSIYPSVPLSVCLTVTNFKLLLLFCFLMESNHFGRQFSMTPLQNIVLRFLI